MTTGTIQPKANRNNSNPAAQDSLINRSHDVVVLIHGLGGNRMDMWRINRHFKKRGFKTINWGYRSLGNRIESHADRLAAKLNSAGDSHPGRIHLVTHSMGGIIVRTMLAKHDVSRIGRVVMLAPPNRGSHMARKLAPWIGWLTPSLKQLSDADSSFVNGLPNSLQERRLEFGIVESTKDRVITQGGVRLEGLSDYASVDFHHGVITWYRDTIVLVENFILHGRFTR